MIPEQPAVSSSTSSPSLNLTKIIWGIMPLILTGLTAMILAMPAGFRVLNGLGGYLFLGGYLAILVGLVFGAVRGFPRWAHAYTLYALFLPLYLTQGSTPGLTLLNIDIWGPERWGWRAWVPLGLALLLIIFLTRSLSKALLDYWSSVRKDWTQLAFGIYNLLPLILWVFSTGVEPAYVLPALGVSIIVLVAGGLMYLTANSTLSRMAALLLCAFLAVSISTAMNQVYWQTHLVNFGTGARQLLDIPLDIGRLFGNTLRLSAYMLVLLLLPGLIGLLPAQQDPVLQD